MTLVVPGQNPYPLVEREKDVLGATNLPESYSIVVRRDGAGQVAGLTLRQETVATSDAVSLPVTETYSDYRSVDGVMIPFVRVSNSPAMGDTVIKVREAAFDVPVPEEAFRRKTAVK